MTKKDESIDRRLRSLLQKQQRRVTTLKDAGDVDGATAALRDANQTMLIMRVTALERRLATLEDIVRSDLMNELQAVTDALRQIRGETEMDTQGGADG